MVCSWKNLVWDSLAILSLATYVASPLSAAPRLPPKPPLSRCAPPAPEHPPAKSDTNDNDNPRPRPDESWTEGSVTIGGNAIDYCAVAGTLVVHPRDWDDATPPAGSSSKTDPDDSDKTPAASASMFYVAYMKRDADAATRPITFLFNGGPGTASVWLHMGAFGPRRVETADARHSAPAPYRLLNNEQSLLDASDTVFIDAPGTGFSRITGTDKEQKFYGVDQDAHAFAEFITGFLSKYKRWNSPKYLFGESYGTMRAAVLVNTLQDSPGIDFNGVIMLSQILSGEFYPDQPKSTPGNDLPYILGLPTYAATAWYHAQPADQRSTNVPTALLNEVEQFALRDYTVALAAGSSLDVATRDAIVSKLHQYTMLPEAYLRRSDLRVGVDEFRQELMHDQGLVIGATDTRFAGHTLDPLSRKARYDPSDAAIGSAFISSFNDYVRRVLKYGEGKTYRPSVDDIGDKWDFSHQSPGSSDSGSSFGQTANVMPDLAQAMKLNPLLKVQLNSGYYDLLTPYLEGRYEIRHLSLPPELRRNVEFRCYQSGHMVYLASDALAQLHDNVADFIDRTANLANHATRLRSPAAECPSGE